MYIYREICTCISIYDHVYIYIYIYNYIMRQATCHSCAVLAEPRKASLAARPAGCKRWSCTANLRTQIVEFRGFDSSIILFLRGGIPRRIGNFLEVLSQEILVGIILVGRLGVRPGTADGDSDWPRHEKLPAWYTGSRLGFSLHAFCPKRSMKVHRRRAYAPRSSKQP